MLYLEYGKDNFSIHSKFGRVKNISKTFTRTIASSIAKIAIVDIVQGVPTVILNEEVFFDGKITHEKAVKLIKKSGTYVGRNFTVVEVVNVNTTYEITLEKFLEHATKIPLPRTDTDEVTEEQI